jgi:hypothetical protein
MVHRLGFGGKFLPICHRKIAALKENSLLSDAGSRTSSAKSSRIIFLIANRILSTYRRSRSDQVLYIGNYLCPTSRTVLFAANGRRPRSLTAVRDSACDRASSVHINSYSKVALAYVSSRTRFLANDQKNIYEVKLIRSLRISSLLAKTCEIS